MKTDLSKNINWGFSFSVCIDRAFPCRKGSNSLKEIYHYGTWKMENLCLCLDWGDMPLKMYLIDLDQNLLYISEFSTLSQEVMSHCCIVLNIINHLIDSSAPVISTTKTQTQVSQNAITNPNASPIKQIKAASIVQDITSNLNFSYNWTNMCCMIRHDIWNVKKYTFSIETKTATVT